MHHGCRATNPIEVGLTPNSALKRKNCIVERAMVTCRYHSADPQWISFSPPNLIIWHRIFGLRPVLNRSDPSKPWLGGVRVESNCLRNFIFT